MDTFESSERGGAWRSLQVDLWITRSLFSISFIHYFLFIDYTGDFGSVVTAFKKPLVRITFTFMIVVCLANVNDVELNEIWIGKTIKALNFINLCCDDQI